MASSTHIINELIEVLSELPGIGRRSAGRIAVRIVKDSNLALKILEVIKKALDNVGWCRECNGLCRKEIGICEICSDPLRDNGKICVVEEFSDIFIIESAGVYDGKYFCIGGKISPMLGIGPEDLKMDLLKEKVQSGQVTELIIALGGDVESDATAYFLADFLRKENLRITRIGFGLPVGAGLQHIDPVTLTRAFESRKPLG